MRKIVIETISNEEQRYPTCGDYWIDSEGTLQVRVSKTTDSYEFLVVIHELIEQFLSEQRGIKGDDIDKFDMKFEMDRKLGKHTLDEEPGDDKNAPYKKEHRFSTAIERLLAHELDVDWNEYETTLENL